MACNTQRCTTFLEGIPRCCLYVGAPVPGSVSNRCAESECFISCGLHRLQVVDLILMWVMSLCHVPLKILMTDVLLILA
jgi:hypothetical protein